MSLRAARPIFCGNLDYDARQSDLERLFGKYGNVERVDIKSGFAFIYMEDEQDADVAVRRLDRKEFGAKGRRLRVEWTKQERGGRKSDANRKASMDNKPSKTLFVINFDPINTRSKDLERHFDSHGKILNVRIRRNFAFVQFDTQQEATKALYATNSSKFMDRILSVEYATRDDDNPCGDNRRNTRSPDRRGRDRSQERGYNPRRSPSPQHRDRDSPDYGHGSKPAPRYNSRRSPSYEISDRSPAEDGETKHISRGERRRSPSYERSPVNDGETKYSSRRERKRSPSYDRLNKSPDNDHGSKPSSHHVPNKSPSYDRSERSPDQRYSRSPSPAE